MRTLNNAAFALVALLLLLAAGCSSSSEAKSSIVGTYKFDMGSPAGKENDPAAAFAKSMMASVTLEFKPDNTFTMTVLFPMEGTYTVTGNEVVMTVTKVMGMTMDEAAKMSNKPMPADAKEPMKMRIEDGGKTLIPIGKNPAGDSAPNAKFVKV